MSLGFFSRSGGITAEGRLGFGLACSFQYNVDDYFQNLKFPQTRIEDGADFIMSGAPEIPIPSLSFAEEQVLAVKTLLKFLFLVIPRSTRWGDLVTGATNQWLTVKSLLHHRSHQFRDPSPQTRLLVIWHGLTWIFHANPLNLLDTRNICLSDSGFPTSPESVQVVTGQSSPCGPSYSPPALPPPLSV